MATEVGSRALDVVGYIDSLVDRQSLRSGDRIATKEEIREATGAARATVNEAVKILRERGRVTLRPGPNGGLFLADVDHGVQVGRFLLAVGKDSKSIADALAVRNHLESMVLAEAITHRTEDDVADLRRIVDQLRRERTDDPLLIRGIFELHLRIGLISPNVILSSTYRGLVAFIRDHVAESPHPAAVSTPDFTAHRVEVHADLVETIIAQDMHRLEQVVARHNEGE